jgi:phage/plasmid-like protein (TIGR03299 family)
VRLKRIDTIEKGKTMETVQNILVSSGLDFEVEKRPHYVRKVERTGDVFEVSKLSSGIFRTDTGDEIGDVGNTYEPAQNADILQPFLEAVKSGHLQYECGRVINKGARFCLNFYTGNDIVINGDKLKKGIMAGGSHDGSWTSFIKTFVYRSACKNGLVFGKRINDVYKVRHTENWRTRYNEVLNTLQETEVYFKEAFAQYGRLFDVKMDIQSMRIATAKLLDIKGEIKAESTRKQNQLIDIMSLTQRGRGIRDNTDIQGTAAAWYNAVTEYLDHHVSRDNLENQFVSAMFGSGEAKKRKAFDIAYSMI